MKEAFVETDATARVDLWRQAEAILVDKHTTILPIYYYDRTGMANPEWSIEYPPLGEP